MSFFDVAMMALHNLWSRKLRTVLNILGVVLACVVLAMMLAGTRGVRDGFDRMINDSDTMKRFAVYSSWQGEDEVPEEETLVEGEMSDDRRARLKKRLKNKWLRENSNRVPLSIENLEKLRSLPHVVELNPHSRLQCELAIGDVKESNAIRIAGRDKDSIERVMFGEYLEAEDKKGIVLGEYSAYRLGFVSDEELKQLVGSDVLISVLLKEKRESQLKQLLSSDLTSLTKAGESLTAMKRLVDAVDMTSLSDRDKELLRSVFSLNQEDEKKQKPGPEDFYEKAFTIRGIARDAKEDEGMSIFNFGGSNSGADIYMAADVVTGIETQQEGFSQYYGATGVVDQVQNIEALTKEIEELGFSVSSPWWLIERIDQEIGTARIVIGALSLLILVISAVGISNTMVVSVLERTREFGILKAMGAQDRNVLQLMLMEGALTGLAGAIVALTFSFALAQLIAIFVRQYIAGKIRQDFDASVFAFTALDICLVMSLAVVVCTLAAVLPAWRAAKLDPVVAMRGR